MTSLDVWIPWPQFPLTTKAGKPSKAKRAGKPVPWLSENVINNLPRPVYSNIRARWVEAARKAAEGLVWTGATPCIFEMILVKRTAQGMDPLAVIEGAKPCVDGLVKAGVWPDDNDSYIRGGVAIARKGSDVLALGLYIRIRAY